MQTHNLGISFMISYERISHFSIMIGQEEDLYVFYKS